MNSCKGFFTTLLVTSLGCWAHAQTLEWAKQLEGAIAEPDDAEGDPIALDGAANVYTTGRFRETSAFDPGRGTVRFTSAAPEDIFVSKLNGAGEPFNRDGNPGKTGTSGSFPIVEKRGKIVPEMVGYLALKRYEIARSHENVVQPNYTITLIIKEVHNEN